MIIYANYEHVEQDTRYSCWNMGGIRCGHIDGRCNKLDKFPYDDSWEKEAKRLYEILD